MNALINQPAGVRRPVNIMPAATTNARVLAARKKQLALTGNGSDLLVPVNTTVILGEGSEQPILPLVITTASVATYKTWIGREDSEADNHPWEMPSQPWNGKRFTGKQQVSAAAAADIEKAGWIYLFNDARKVAGYEQAIEDYYGDFQVSVYHIRRLLIQPGGNLVLRGGPAMLLIDEMEMQQTGKLYTYTPCHVTVGTLKKSTQQFSVNN